MTTMYSWRYSVKTGISAVPSNRAPQPTRVKRRTSVNHRGRAGWARTLHGSVGALTVAHLRTESLKTLLPFNYEPTEIARMLST